MQLGKIRVCIEDRCIEVTVADIGPGIPDIQLAMQEGFTTAPPYVKQLGYGSGMGLPNIKKSLDWMEIQSELDRGTTFRFRVNFDEAQRGERVKNPAAAVLDPTVFWQFGDCLQPSKIANSFLQIGFSAFTGMEEALETYRDAVLVFLSSLDRPLPAISSTCPAVVHLM